MPNSKNISLIFYETITICCLCLAVLFNGCIVLCTLRKKSLIKCPSTKFVFSLCASHLMISILILMISIIQPFINLPSHNNTNNNFNKITTTIIPKTSHQTHTNDNSMKMTTNNNSKTSSSSQQLDTDSSSDSNLLHSSNNNNVINRNLFNGISPTLFPKMMLMNKTSDLFDENKPQDLFVSTTNQNNMTYYNYNPKYGYYYYYYVFSYIMLYGILIVSMASSLTVAVISIERYITIARPMKYKSIITSTRCTISLIICWSFSAICVLVLPLCIFGNQIEFHHETLFTIPTGQLGLYFAILFSITTVGVLIIMMLCYGHIFQIAKEKCQKVQIGHFTSPVSSISSDWPSSVYSSQGNEGQLLHLLNSTSSSSGANILQTAASKTTTAVTPNHTNNIVSRIPSSTISNVTSASLLQYVLATNLVGKHANAKLINAPQSIVTLENDCKDSAEGKISSNEKQPHQHESRRASTGSMTKTTTAQIRPIHNVSKLKKWTTFLQQNYNSPNKTISTIMLLISSIILTQVPLCIVLFCTPSSTTTTHHKVVFEEEQEAVNNNENPSIKFPTTTLLHYYVAATAAVDQGSPTLYYFCIRFLFIISSILHPILYGFLNRNIRNQLWKLCRLLNRKTKCPSASFYQTYHHHHHATKAFANVHKKSLSNSMNCRSQVQNQSQSSKRKININPLPVVVAASVTCENYLNIKTINEEQRSNVLPLNSLAITNDRNAEVQLNSNSNANSIKDNHISIVMTFDDANNGDNNDADSDEFEQVLKDHQCYKDKVTKFQEEEEYDDDDDDDDELDDYDEIIDEELLSLSSFPRKPSQDSGADMSFTDDDEPVVPEQGQDIDINANEEETIQKNNSTEHEEQVGRGCVLKSSSYSNSTNLNDNRYNKSRSSKNNNNNRNRNWSK